MVAKFQARKIAVAAVLAAFASTPALAEEPVTYITFGGGLNIAGDSDIDGTGVDTEAEFDSGPAARIALGFDYASPLRSEIELSQRWNDIDSIGGASGTGDANVTSLMTNLYYDFSNDSLFTPFLGLGVGGSLIDADGQSPIAGSRVDDTDVVFSAQGIAGVLYQYDEQWSFGLDYRYLVAPIVDVRTDSGTDLDTEYDSHTLMFSLRYDFATPPKPMAEPEPEPEPVVQVIEPEPEPEPEPVQIPRAFLVFFDWDDASLTPEARDIIASAAQYAQNGGISRIDVTGHADRSGTDQYNIGLSKRRAEAVMAEFARLGVSRDAIGVEWKGEREPLVATGDGVREPQNRRVEIVFP